jgi:hypothetical protein
MRSFRDHHSLEEQRRSARLSSSTVVRNSNDDAESSSILAFLREFAFPGWSLNRNNYNNNNNDDASTSNRTGHYTPTTIADCTTKADSHHTKLDTIDERHDMLPIITTTSEELRLRNTRNNENLTGLPVKTSRRSNTTHSTNKRHHKTTIVIDESSSEIEPDNNDDNHANTNANDNTNDNDDRRVNLLSPSTRNVKVTISHDTWRDKHTPINQSSVSSSSAATAMTTPSLSSDLRRTWRFINTPSHTTSFSSVNNVRRLSTINSTGGSESDTSIYRLNDSRISKTPMPRSRRRGLFHRQVI